MSDPLTPADLDELERLLAAATDGRWSVNALRIVRGNALVCTLPLNYRGPAPADAAAIVALHNAAPALIAAARDLAWHEDRHGTRAEQEAEDAEFAADLARIDALSDEECKAELAAEGIDYDASRKKVDTVIKLCAERADLRARLETAERERDEAHTALSAFEYADEEIRRPYGAEFGLLDADDSPPCWADFAEHIRTLTRERDEARAEADRLRAFVPVWRMKRYSPDAVTWRLFVGDTAIPDTGLHPIKDGRVFASGDGEGYPDLPTAARAVCARLGIPSVEVPDP